MFHRRRLHRSIHLAAILAVWLGSTSAWAAGQSPTPRATDLETLELLQELAALLASDNKADAATDWSSHPGGGRYRATPPESADVAFFHSGDGEAACLDLSAALTASPAAAKAVPRAAGKPVGRLRFDSQRLSGAGADSQVYLYAPGQVRLGSSISHWDPVASPDLLMEPALRAGTGLEGLDLSLDLMRDLGWPVGSFESYVLDIGVSQQNPHSGLFDPRPIAPSAGNPATTLGAARSVVFDAALAVWGGELGSPMRVDTLLVYRPLPCQEGVGAVLASVRPLGFFADHPMLPRPGIAYPAALASALTGEDLTGPLIDYGGDIFITINSAIDEGCLGNVRSFYHGLDGKPAEDQIDLMSVLLHEFGHGLGFANETNEISGEQRGGVPSIFDAFTLDKTTGRTWDEMIDAERAASAAQTRRVVWNGPAVTDRSAEVLSAGVVTLELSTDDKSIEMVTSVADFDPSPGSSPGLEIGELQAALSCFVDGEAAPSILDACSPAADPTALSGKIAIIERGACEFTTKARHAQEAGALAVVVCPGRVLSLQGGRFEVSATWQTPQGSGSAIDGGSLNDHTGWFSFFSPDNVEVTVKMIDACDVAAHDAAARDVDARDAPGSGGMWFFAAGMTNAAVELTVSDRESGTTRRYTHSGGRLFEPIADTTSFTCL